MRYVRPDESIMFWGVSGTVQATYQPTWLTDGLPGSPARGATSLSLTASGSARTISLLSAVNTNITGTIGISGGVTATIPAATYRADGIPLNSWVSITPVVGATSLVMAVTQTPAIVGELYAGTSRTLERELFVDPDFDAADLFPWEGEFSSLAPYDPGLDYRRLAGQTLVSQAGMDDIEAWWASTRRGTRPTLIVPFESKNDAWLVVFRYTAKPTFSKPGTGQHYRVSFEFLELPRYRW